MEELPLIVAGAAQDVERVREKLRHGVERFDRALWAAGQIDDQRLAPNPSSAARESGARILPSAVLAHHFGDSRHQLLASFRGGFRGGIPRAYPGASGR